MSKYTSPTKKLAKSHCQRRHCAINLIDDFARAHICNYLGEWRKRQGPVARCLHTLAQAAAPNRADQSRERKVFAHYLQV